MAVSAASAPFYVFDQAIELPFKNGMTATVSAAMSAVQAPVTALIVLWIIITGIMVMRGDMSVRSGISRIISTSLVVGLVMSAALYNQYIVTFFTTGIPDWIASSLLGVGGTQPSAQQFDAVNVMITQFCINSQKDISFYNVLYCVEWAVLQVAIEVPIIIMFLIYETTRIITIVVVCIGPFVLPGYLFAATRSVADHFISKLLGLSILTLMVDVLMSIIMQGDIAYIRMVTSNANGASIPETLTIGIQLLCFLTIGSLISTFLPGIASYIGGGVSVSPMAMMLAVSQVASPLKQMTSQSKK